MTILSAWWGSPGHLTGPERRALREAILAGADRESLSMALSDAANARTYDQLVRSADFETEINELIGKAVKQGWLDDLIAAFVGQTSREDLIAQAQAIGAKARERRNATGDGATIAGLGLRRKHAVMALAVIVIVAIAIYLFTFRDPNFVVRLIENDEPVSKRSVFVAQVGDPKRYLETTNSHGEAYFRLELGSGRLYRFGVRTDQSAECTFPVFTATDAREVVYELNPKTCRSDSNGLVLRTESPQQPGGISGARDALPTDQRARLNRAPLGLPNAPLVLDRRYYSLGFDPSIRSPRWVGFTVDAQRALQLRRLPDHPIFDPAFPEQWQTGEEAYRSNRYDRGSLIRRADAGVGADEAEARESEREIFYYSVTVPQTDVTNRTTWSAVEIYTTDLSARIGPIHVIAGPVYPNLSDENGAYLTLGQSRTVVPLSLYRVLLRKTIDGQWRTIAFLVPNDGSSERNPRVFATSVAAIEKMTGLTFFPRLPPEEAAALKSNTSLEAFES